MPGRAHQPPGHRLGGHARERPLQNFPGTIVAISHDEHLVRAWPTASLTSATARSRSTTATTTTTSTSARDLAARAAAEAAGENTPATAKSAKVTAASARCARRRFRLPRAKDQGAKARRGPGPRRASTKSSRACATSEEDRSGARQKRARYDELMELMASEELYADRG